MAFSHLVESPSLHVADDMFSILHFERIHRALDLSREQIASIAEAEIKNIRFRQEKMREIPRSKGPLRTPEFDQAMIEAREVSTSP